MEFQQEVSAVLKATDNDSVTLDGNAAVGKLADYGYIECGLASK